MNKTENEKVLSEQIVALSKGVIATVKMMQKERERTDSIVKATWSTMSRREKPTFVKSLRNDGYSQKEIGNMVGLTQGAISQYEKKFDMANGNK